MIVDDSQLRAFADELDAAAGRTLAAVEPVMDASMARVRDGARRLIRGQIRGLYLPHYAAAITSETVREPAAVVGEVGPELDHPQGGMGPGVEFGSANTGPRPHLLPAGEAEEPTLADQLAAFGIGVLR